MSELTKKKIANHIQNALKENTKFMYHRKINFEVCDFVKTTTKDRVELDVINGNYKIREAFVLQAIDELGYATADMVNQWLWIQKKKFPTKNIPIFRCRETSILKEEIEEGIIKVNQTITINDELRLLSKKGLIRATDYVAQTESKSVIIVYTCNMYGHLLFRNMLDIYSAYDESVIFRADTEIFRRLGATAIGLALACSPNCKNIYINSRYGFGEFKKIGYTYSVVQFEKEEEKMQYVIEPIYFAYDERIATEEEIYEKINERLDRVRKIVESCSEIMPTKVIFCLENMDGLKKFMKLIKTKELQFYLDALYTSENVLYKSHCDLKQSFLHMKVEGDKQIMIPAMENELFLQEAEIAEFC